MQLYGMVSFQLHLRHDTRFSVEFLSLFITQYVESLRRGREIIQSATGSFFLPFIGVVVALEQDSFGSADI